jgi:DNA-3-methyladenine glycosylase I
MTRKPQAALARCPWAKSSDGLYERYHDTEWGVPHADDTRLFEKLLLEGFQSGLSWITILKKRERFREAFHGFDAERIARYGKRDISRLMSDAGIIRNRLKIEAAIDNAKAYLSLRERTTLAAYVWGLLADGPVDNSRRSLREIPAVTEDSKRISKALKDAGFRFVGPTTVYAFMQSVGMVNDHLVSCPRHAACRKLLRAFTPPTR